MRLSNQNLSLSMAFLSRTIFLKLLREDLQNNPRKRLLSNEKKIKGKKEQQFFVDLSLSNLKGFMVLYS